jgi:hypothetical protein
VPGVPARARLRRAARGVGCVRDVLGHRVGGGVRRTEAEAPVTLASEPLRAGVPSPRLRLLRVAWWGVGIEGRPPIIPDPPHPLEKFAGISRIGTRITRPGPSPIGPRRPCRVPARLPASRRSPTRRSRGAGVGGTAKRSGRPPRPLERSAPDPKGVSIRFLFGCSEGPLVVGGWGRGGPLVGRRIPSRSL